MKKPKTPENFSNVVKHFESNNTEFLTHKLNIKETSKLFVGTYVHPSVESETHKQLLLSKMLEIALMVIYLRQPAILKEESNMTRTNVLRYERSDITTQEKND